MADQMPVETKGAFSGWVEDQVRNTPWWLISVAFHMIVLAGMTVITFKETIVPPSEPPIIVRPAEPKKKFEFERPIDPFAKLDGVKFADLKDRPSENDDPVIMFPEAEESDHNESADEMDKGTMKGDSKEFLGWMEGSSGSPIGRGKGGPGSTDALGVGGGAGDAGRHGDPFGGGRRNLRKVGLSGTRGPTSSTENAVTFGLKWLARHQSPDGRWSSEGFHAHCGKSGKCDGPGWNDFDAGVTGLALLAFLGAGHTPLTKETYIDAYTGKTVRWGEVVKNGLKWLITNQDAEGCFGGRNGGKYMYNHTIAALAMAEAYGLTESPLFRDPAQAGIDFLLASQNPYKAWRYAKLSGDNDTSVTGWAVMALKSAEISKLKVGRTGYEGAKAFIAEVTDEAYYRVGYRVRGDGPVYSSEHNKDWTVHQAMTAVGMLCRIFIDKDAKDPALQGGATMLVADLPKYAEKNTDYYYWYYGSLALFQFDGPDGKFWNGWVEAMKNAIVPNQKSNKDGCAHGSWDVKIDRWGEEGGRVYTTAINVLTLEVWYRYENAFGGKRGK